MTSSRKTAAKGIAKCGLTVLHYSVFYQELYDSSYVDMLCSHNCVHGNRLVD